MATQSRVGILCRFARRGSLSLRLLLCLTFLGGPGCTRRFFRERADREVADILAEKDQFPAWKIEDYHVYPDPRARFADPTNPDRPPMPPDDPAAYALSPISQKPGQAGIALVGGNGYLDLLAEWDAENRRALGHDKARQATVRGQMPEQIAAPSTTSETTLAPTTAETVVPAVLGPNLTGCGYPFPKGERPFLIRMEQAIELGLINNREYQDRREDLYLRALPVTLQRFSFAAQFEATDVAIRERTGKLLPEGQHNRWRNTANASASKLFSTGALLLLRFANLTTVELTGQHARHTTTQSTMSLDLVQPLLQGGGRAVTLEGLTNAERELVYAIRTYARFRKEFFVSLATGSNITGGGGLAGQAALNLILGFTPQREGYLPTSLDFALLDVEKGNVRTLEDFLKRFEAYKEGGDYSQLQVDQVEQNLLQARSNVLRLKAGAEDSLDRYKLQLGLPSSIPLALDDTPIRPMAEQLKRFEEVFSDYEAAREAAATYGAVEQSVSNASAALGSGFVTGGVLNMIATMGTEPGTIGQGFMNRSLRARLASVATNSKLVRDTRFSKNFLPRWQVWEKLDVKELAARLSELGRLRNSLLDLKTDMEKLGRTLTDAEKARLTETELQLDVGRFELDLRRFEEKPWQQGQSQERRNRIYASVIRDVMNDFIVLLGEARNERFERIRKSWPDLPRCCVNGFDLVNGEEEAAYTVAGQATLVNRFDLMNARAQLVDTWRQIAVSANGLLGVFDVRYHMDALSVNNNPFHFTGSAMRNQLQLNTELPLIRKSERNNYRAVLIGFQRQRRGLMQAEDVALVLVRQELRQLRQLAENYKIQQRAVEVAYQQVESSLETIGAPPIPTNDPTGGGGGGGAGNATALTNQLLQAQQRATAAQSQLYTFWVNYQVARLQLFRDLELMRLDSRGVWIDESPANESSTDDRVPVAASDRIPEGERHAGGDERGLEPRPLALATGTPR